MTVFYIENTVRVIITNMTKRRFFNILALPSLNLCVTHATIIHGKVIT